MYKIIHSWQTLALRFTLCRPGTAAVVHARSAGDAAWDLQRLRRTAGGMQALRAGAARHGLRTDLDDEAFMATLLAELRSGRLVLLAEPIAAVLPAGREAAPGRAQEPGPAPPRRTWIEVQVVDDRSPPRPFAALGYRLHTPDGALHEGELDACGRLRIGDLEPGECRLELVDLRAARTGR